MHKSHTKKFILCTANTYIKKEEAQRNVWREVGRERKRMRKEIEMCYELDPQKECEHHALHTYTKKLK